MSRRVAQHHICNSRQATRPSNMTTRITISLDHCTVLYVHGMSGLVPLCVRCCQDTVPAGHRPPRSERRRGSVRPVSHNHSHTHTPHGWGDCMDGAVRSNHLLSVPHERDAEAAAISIIAVNCSEVTHSQISARRTMSISISSFKCGCCQSHINSIQFSGIVTSEEQNR